MFPAVARAAAAAAPDAALVRRFARTRDPDAFAALVKRHGPMVLAVCRRVTADCHLADDAFQAAFLVLARRAADVKPAAAVGNFLYGVAYRTARDARRMIARRREAPLAADPPAPQPADADALARLDAEIARLPDRLRTAVVLCELEGRSRRDVAADLGVPEGTLSSRLAQARKLLAARLRAQGVGPPAALLAAAAVPPGLTAAVVSGVVPARAADLAHGVMRTMFLAKLKTMSLAAAVGLAALALLLSAARSDTPPPAETPAAKPAAPPRVGELLFHRGVKFAVSSPTGENERAVDLGKGLYVTMNYRLAPDGKRIAYLCPEYEFVGNPLGGQQAKLVRYTVAVRGVKDDGPSVDLKVAAYTMAWSPDGSAIAVTDWERGTEKMFDPSVHHVVDVKTQKATPLPLPDDHLVNDWSRDGRYFLTVRHPRDKAKPGGRLWLMNRDGTPVKPLTDPDKVSMFGRLSPDGTRVLYQVLTPRPGGRRPASDMMVLDVKTRVAKPVAGVSPAVDVGGYCWSPDGKRVAYTWQDVAPGLRSGLVVCDPDGGNPTPLTGVTTDNDVTHGIGGLDWR